MSRKFSPAGQPRRGDAAAGPFLHGGAAAGPLLQVGAAALLALVLTFAAFGPALRGTFVSDDLNAVVENEWVTGHFDPAGIVTHFSWWSSGRADSPAYRPATTLSFALSRITGGLEPSAFRVVNFMLNALCAALLFVVARGLGLGLAASAAATAVFAVLPIHSEAVIWVVGRAELGAAVGFLLATAAVLRHRRDGSAVALVVAGLAVAVGMAFKENAVTVLAVPVFLALVLGEGGPPSDDRSRRPEKSAASALRRDAASFVALATGIALYALLRSSASGPALAADPGSLLDNPLSVVDPGTRLLGAIAVLGRYLVLTVWPASLCVDYSWNALGIGPGFRASVDTAVALVFLAACIVVLRKGPGQRPVVALGLLFAAAAFSIVSNTVFVLGTILGERLFYLPTAGLCLAAAALVEPALESRDRRHRIAWAAIALVLVASILVDRRRSEDWKTPVTLFEAAVRVVPSSARAHMELGSAYGQAGRLEDASRHFAEALEIKPDYVAAAYNFGNTLARSGRFDEAAATYRKALAVDPAFTRAWHNLALTEKIRGRPEAWVEAMQKAVASSPRSVVLLGQLGEALLATGRNAEAIRVYDAAAEAGASDAVTFFNRAVARHRDGGCVAAVEDYRRATSSPGAPAQAFTFAAGCLRELGRNEEAATLEARAKVANRDTRR